MLDDRKTLPTEVTILCKGIDRTLLQIVLKEGRNRQIRRVAEQLGHPVFQLHRTQIGSIQLKPAGSPELPSGRYRFLEKFEICFLNSQIDLLSKVDSGSIEECTV
jgi:23S rRNA pseudouridine2605 synthase